MTRAVLAWLFAVSFVVFAARDARAATPQAGAAALESRLYAPCCYAGTLDVHESELARELRKEIEARLASGETADSIQADFVDRYGEQVIAARSDRPIATMTLSLLALLGLAGVGVGLVMRRWSRHLGVDLPPLPAKPQPRDALDVRLDAELADLD